jgi:hypothetical protein
MKIIRRLLHFEFFDSSEAKNAKREYPAERKQASHSSSSTHDALRKKSKLDEISLGEDGRRKKKKGRKNLSAGGGSVFE